MAKKVKTPIRYPGGKSRAIKHLDKFFPKEISEIREPMCGGASVALHLKQKHPEAKLWLNDKYYNLYCFWKTLQYNPRELMYRLTYNKGICGDSIEKHREFFEDAKARLQDDSTSDSFNRAAAFFIANRCSYGGLTEIGSFSKTAALGRFTFSSISKLLSVSNLIQDAKITCLDYNALLKEPGDKNTFIFLDPPYDILKTNNDHLYKHHHDFNHIQFWVDYMKCEYKSMITYNYSEDLVKRYKPFIQEKWNLKYGFHHKKEADGTLSGNSKDELLIMNYKKELK